MKVDPSIKRDASQRGIAATELLHVRVEYWKTRLEHTLSYTQAAAKQIYLIDGAALAFIYFTVTSLNFSPSIAWFLATLTLVLSSINYVHSQFLVSQQHWYNTCRSNWRHLVAVDPLDEKRLSPKRFTKTLLTSSHGNMKLLHIVISLWFMLLTVLLVLYALGHVTEIQFRELTT